MPEPTDSIRLAIFASGQGSNAREIIRYFHETGTKAGGRRVEVVLICSNRPGAGVISHAREAQIPVLLLEREIFFGGSHYLPELTGAKIDFIILAGFLWKIPAGITGAFAGRVINIHPALLPAYGGKGMYGGAVHAAVIAAGETESGISIHDVDEQYDHGHLLFQARCAVLPDDTAETLAARIHALEHRHYPEQIARWIGTKKSLKQ